MRTLVSRNCKRQQRGQVSCVADDDRGLAISHQVPQKVAAVLGVDGDLRTSDHRCGEPRVDGLNRRIHHDHDVIVCRDAGPRETGGERERRVHQLRIGAGLAVYAHDLSVAVERLA